MLENDHKFKISILGDVCFDDLPYDFKDKDYAALLKYLH